MRQAYASPLISTVRPGGQAVTDDEFVQFIQDAVAELNEKQDVLKREYGFGDYARWAFDQVTEKFHLLDEAGGIVVEADVVDIGSYSPESNTFKWAWSNSSVLPALREKSARIKGLEGYTGIPLFGYENAFTVEDESMAWELAAIAVKYIGALGCYRAPSSSGGPHTFLALTWISRR